MSEIQQNPEVNPDKIRKDVLDLQDKKRTLILSLQKDIDAIDSDILNEFCKIGEGTYELYSKGEDSLTTLKESFESIDRHKEARVAKEKKTVEISERYDEEIELLEKLLPKVEAEEKVEIKAEPEPASVPTENAGQAFCANCGTPYSPADDIFCASCGSKLQP